MQKLAAFGRFLTSAWVSLPVLAAIGVAVGALVFFNLFPGKPQIGIITIPFTVINEQSAFVITSYLDYVRTNDRIKGVVITLSSPGGGATSSERLYIETTRVRDEKPVIMVMNSLVASGGFMMAMGVNHSYVKTSSLVGNVGVVAGAPPLVPATAPEYIIYTGPDKLFGSNRRAWISTLDMLKQSFAQMVITERGDKLRISKEELVEGRLYAGMEAVRLGLADEIGDQTEAIEKAAEMAGITDYELVDVNVEVDRLFVQKIRRIFAASDGQEPDLLLPALLGLPAGVDASGEPINAAVVGQGQEQRKVSLGELRQFMINGALTDAQEDPLPGFPLEIQRPNIYYMYAGYAGHAP